MSRFLYPPSRQSHRCYISCVNYRFIINQLGILLFILSGILLGVELTFFIIARVQESGIDTDARLAFFLTGGIGLFCSGVVWFATRSREEQPIGRRDALLLVSLSWLLGAAYAAIPFFAWAHLHEEAGLSHPFRSYIDCYFEAMSGLTTTGATVLSEIETLPRSLLLWRAFTHWLGGLGIVVLFVAVLPSLGVGGKRLFRVETPGPKAEGVRPSIRDTARVLWYIYLGLTLAQISALLIAGMGWFDAVCHTFATLATGGFSTKNASTGEFTTVGFSIIFFIFMFMAGMNFRLFYDMLHRPWREVLRDTELRVYAGIVVIASIIIIGSLWASADPIVTTTGDSIASDFDHSLREGALTTISIQTTTGFATSDSNQWPFAAKAVLIALMFVGGCAGSTAGGIKVIRIWIALKILLAEVEHVFRPNVVRPIRLGNTTIDSDLKMSTIAYVLGIVVLFAIGGLTIMLLEQLNTDSNCSFTTAATASLATICTIGPGLEEVGATQNYGWFSPLSKVFMCILMVMGRLEVFAILVLFNPHFWKGE